MHWKGSEQLYAHWSELSDYIDGLQERVLEMRGRHTEASLSAYVCVVEEDSRSRAVELARTPRAPMPWSTALLQAAHDDANRWDQRRDFLSSSTARVSCADCRREERIGPSSR